MAPSSSSSSSSSLAPNRLFSKEQKEECWRAARVVPGRDDRRWRFDAAGNAVLKKLSGCNGCACWSADHRVPYAKGGATDVDNCQVLQTRVNLQKGSLLHAPPPMLVSWSCAVAPLSQREMDLLELAVYGGVSHSSTAKATRVPNRNVLREPTFPSDDRWW